VKHILRLAVIPVFCAVCVVGCGKNKIERSTDFVKDGLVKYKSGAYENAIVSLKRALELNPGNARAHYYLGAVYRDYTKMPDNKDAAVKELRDCIAKDINYIDAYMLLASILLKQGKPEEVEKLTKQAIQIQDESPDPHYWLAESYFHRDMYESAQAECKRALRIDGAHGPSRQLLRKVTQVLGY
jgi:tetratricopeptide (TPR) repeat protein